jgi:hypothetical protein
MERAGVRSHKMGSAFQGEVWNEGLGVWEERRRNGGNYWTGIKRRTQDDE